MENEYYQNTNSNQHSTDPVNNAPSQDNPMNREWDYYDKLGIVHEDSTLNIESESQNEIAEQLGQPVYQENGHRNEPL